MRTRLTAAALVGALVLAGCGSSEDPTPDDVTSSAGTDCAAPAAADTSTVDGWLGYLAENPEDYGLLVTPAGGSTDAHPEFVSHNADEVFPAASAFKIVHLAAYARAVAAGTVDPRDTVSMDDWERWYFPTDGGAHPAALDYLKIPSENGIATDRARTVTYAQLVDVMIRFSDSAAPDLLRDKLGTDALQSVMSDYGFPGAPATFLGLYLAAVDPSLDTPEAREQAAQRYTTDNEFVGEKIRAATQLDPAVLTDPDAPGATDPDNSDIVATPRALHDLMLSISDGSFGDGTKTARQVLEYQGADEAGNLVGFKGGSLPGVLTDAFEYRGADNSTGAVVLMVRNLSATDAANNEFTHQQLLLGALTNREVAAALRCVSD